MITRLFWESIMGRLILGWLVAIAAGLFGLTLSWTGDYPAGASIIMVFGLLLLGAGLLRWGLAQKEITPPPIRPCIHQQNLLDLLYGKPY